MPVLELVPWWVASLVLEQVLAWWVPVLAAALMVEVILALVLVLVVELLVGLAVMVVAQVVILVDLPVVVEWLDLRLVELVWMVGPQEPTLVAEWLMLVVGLKEARVLLVVHQPVMLLVLVLLQFLG